MTAVWTDFMKLILLCTVPAQLKTIEVKDRAQTLMQRIHDRCRRVHELRDELKRAMAAKDRPTIERVVKELEVRLRRASTRTV